MIIANVLSHLAGSMKNSGSYTKQLLKNNIIITVQSTCTIFICGGYPCFFFENEKKIDFSKHFKFHFSRNRSKICQRNVREFVSVL